MMNTFLEVALPITREEIIEVASKLNVELPTDFIEHYIRYNGGYPFRRFYRWPNGQKTRVDHFFSILNEGYTQLEEVYNDMFLTETILPSGYVPFAVDDGANFFCVCVLPDNYDSVFYAAMYHYNPENPFDYLVKISSSFVKFVEELIV